MPGHYCTIGENSFRPEAKNPSLKLCLLAVAACAATAAYLTSSGSQTHLEQYSGVTSRVRNVRPVVAPAGKPMEARAAASAAVQEPPAVQQFYVQQPVKTGTVTGTVAVAGGIFMLAAAAFAYAQQLLTKPQKTEAVAMLATSSEQPEKEAMRQLVATLDAADMRVLSRGGSMLDVVRSKGIDEVAQAIRADQLSRKDLTPKDVILEMQRGNGRFWMGLSERPDMDAMSRRALIMAQAPKICILSCSDSRVPVEIIFDQGLGEIFVVRMAGNILDANAHGSIEYAVKYLGVKVILVIGHEGCGAVKGAIGMSTEDISKEPFDLQVVLQSIRGGLDVKELNGITDVRSREREAIVLNTSNQVKKLQQNQLIAEKMSDGSLLVAGAFYEISSGIVDFFSLDKNGLVIDI